MQASNKKLKYSEYIICAEVKTHKDQEYTDYTEG